MLSVAILHYLTRWLTGGAIKFVTFPCDDLTRERLQPNADRVDAAARRSRFSNTVRGSVTTSNNICLGTFLKIYYLNAYDDWSLDKIVMQ